MSNIWVVVANQAEADIFSMTRLRGSLTPVDSLTNEAGKAHPRDLVADSPGRVHDRIGPGRHSMEPDVGVKDDELRRFAGSVVRHLETARSRGLFDRLIIVAAPEFLGVLRKALTDQLVDILVEEIPKDMVGHDLPKIEAQFA
jgi:protein required for attachment to host cells